MIAAGNYVKDAHVNVLGLTFKENCADLPRADAIVAAVSHRPLLTLSTEEIAHKLIKGGCFIDVKAAFDAGSMQGGYGYGGCRLALCLQDFQNSLN
jgi:UDP-N-acetyl-D-galactosamine dehydrogenase